MYIHNDQILIRLILATIFGGIVGMEREYHNRPAGLRTHILVSLVSCLIMIVGIEIHEVTGGNDPTRLAAQVVSGIGFLGAGTIIRTGSSIRGLTTAATLWANAGIGLAVGAGLYYASGISVSIVMITLFALSKIEETLNNYKTKTITGKLINSPDAPNKLADEIVKSGGIIRKMHINKRIENSKHPYIHVVYKLNINDDDKVEEMIANISSLDSIIELFYQGNLIISKDKIEK
ncbi:MAG: MgtC/SapB family protein [Tissierellia bacterium]|nr:MgtC/SapB family protein [Tissierellia bacterium]